jgi:hypothetical protein
MVFIAAAALAMRRVLADHARSRRWNKRDYAPKIQLEGYRRCRRRWPTW